MNDLVPLKDIREMATIIGPLFNKKTDDMLALMLIAQAEGKPPAIAAQEYDIIQGRPALTARAAQARFQLAGGKIEWISRTDLEVSATFSHPAGGSLTIKWDIRRAEKAGIGGRDMWKKYPTQMMSARVVSEGVRAIFPACLSGMYLPEEIEDGDFTEPRNVTPQIEHNETGQINGYQEIIDAINSSSTKEQLQEKFAAGWKTLANDPEGRKIIQGPYNDKKKEFLNETSDS